MLQKEEAWKKTKRISMAKNKVTTNSKSGILSTSGTRTLEMVHSNYTD